MTKHYDKIKGFHHHDHVSCVNDALATARNTCKRDGLKFTESRQRVLEILLEGHTAMGAYDILERLNEEGGKPQPPVVYRALEFLINNGFAHKIEQLNAFIACVHSDTDHRPAFMICRECNVVAETHVTLMPAEFEQLAAQTGFQIEQTVVEARGLCPNCAIDT